MELPDSIKKPLDAFSSAIVDRFRNPFAASFIISWVVFNWKPIFFLLRAKVPIDLSIKYVETFFSDQNHYLWFPLCSAVSYSVVLPYIGVAIDWMLKYYISYRNKSLVKKQVQAIQNQKEIVLEQIALEEAEKERRELKAHNKFVDELQTKNKSLEEQLELQSKEFKTSYETLKDRYTEISDTSKESIENLEQALKKAKDINLQLTTNYQELHTTSQAKAQRNDDSLFNLEKELSECQQRLSTLIEDKEDLVREVKRFNRMRRGFLTILKESNIDASERLLQFMNNEMFVELKFAHNYYYFKFPEYKRVSNLLFEEVKSKYSFIVQDIPIHTGLLR